LDAKFEFWRLLANTTRSLDSLALRKSAAKWMGRLETIMLNTTTVRLTDAERAREAALRQRFAEFWASTSADLRATYDSFISASPLVPEVTLEAVNAAKVHGWWVRPARAESRRAILFIHGGGYVLGSAAAYRGFVSQIVRRTQIPALVIDYPLAPEATLPAGPEAALGAWQWLVERGFEQIAIVGDSAGGGLSLVTLTQLAKKPHGPTPVAGVVFSPWVDMTFTGMSMKDATITDPLINYDYLQDCARKYLGNREPNDPLASPLFGDLRGLPPLLIQVGTDERLLDDSRQFADRAARAGVSVALDVWEGMHHVFQLDVAHIESSRIALDNAARFLHDAFTGGLAT
jgi:monoterpene epsilon-lactone hydrolase